MESNCLLNSGRARMRSPSERLIQLLTTSGLCTRAELDHCEPFVRQLCQDLPDFDSVWLDALVQQRFLTPWQADQIQAEKTDSLVIGRFQCLRPLGRSTFLARQTNKNSTAVLRSLNTPESTQRSLIERRLEELIGSIDRSRSSAPSSLVLPTEIVTQEITPTTTEDGPSTNSKSYLVSTYLDGWSMEELLIRGGRLPSPVVAEIGRELLSALAWLESVRLLHGDLVLRNVRLHPRGGVCLTAAFVRRLLQPQFALTDQLTLRDCDGIAPEQVGTGRSADARSELYSLGCLLWQLLTSRPVVLSADPVNRLMKQKEHDIPDVRNPVPDCPEWMSRIIVSMTRRSPELRPVSATEVLKLWRKHSGNGFSQCRILARSMPDHSVRTKSRPLVRSRSRSRSLVWPAAATAALGTLVVLTARSGILPKTLTLNSLSEFTTALMTPESAPNSNASPSTSDVVATNTGPLPLPPVNADGIIPLEAGKSYFAEPREFPGSLRITSQQSSTEDPAVAQVIVRTGSRWQLRARSIELQGIRLIQQSSNDTIDSSVETTTRRKFNQLLELQCGSLTIIDCVVQSPALADRFEGIAWLRAPGEQGVVIVHNTVFAGGGYGISMNHPPRRCEFDNVLFANRVGGLLCEIQKGDSDTWDVSCHNVTQRFGFSLGDVVVHDNGIKQLNLNVTSAECVYEPQMAILRLHAPESWRPDAMTIQLRSGDSNNPAVVPPDIQPVVYIDRRLAQPVSLPESQITENSLLLADLIFDSPPSTNRDATGSETSFEWIGSSLLDFEGPKLSTVMPGVDVKRLPRQ